MNVTLYVFPIGRQPAASQMEAILKNYMTVIEPQQILIPIVTLTTKVFEWEVTLCGQ